MSKLAIFVNLDFFCHRGKPKSRQFAKSPRRRPNRPGGFTAAFHPHLLDIDPPRRHEENAET